MVTRATHPYNRQRSNKNILDTLKYGILEPATRKDLKKEVAYRKSVGKMRKDAKVGSKIGDR